MEAGNGRTVMMLLGLGPIICGRVGRYVQMNWAIGHCRIDVTRSETVRHRKSWIGDLQTKRDRIVPSKHYGTSMGLMSDLRWSCGRRYQDPADKKSLVVCRAIAVFFFAISFLYQWTRSLARVERGAAQLDFLQRFLEQESCCRRLPLSAQDE